MAKAFQAPKGTRDFYPREIHRRRFVERAWRDTSIRHAFDEIEGPTFEHLELYTAKSGEGIVSELFSFRREGGDDTYALRPEFTPTLARMFAARAPQLPRPTRWFWQQNCFRAERPQKGRLREFLQWNCDVIGLPSGDTSTPEGLLRAKASADAEVISACVGLLASLGLKPADVRVRYSHRGVLAGVISAMGVPEEHVPSAFVLLDRREKLDDAELEAMAFEFGVSSYEFITFLKRPRGRSSMEDVAPWLSGSDAALLPIRLLEQELATAGIQAWCELDLNIARGLAYYTGTVFEVHEASGSQRAVAGGGRYDNLIELFGGPPTPAVGFGMGDVVLSLVLEDRGLFPDGKDLLTALSAPLASLRPEAFVISNGVPEAEAAVRPLVSRLRAGTPGLRPLHARWTDKATRNIGKLLKDATDAHARTAIIIESASQCTLKDLDSGAQQGVPIDQVVAALASILGRS